MTDFDNLLAQSDVITLHVPFGAETNHLIDAEKLKLMKPTAFLINTSRGGIIDEVALANALKNKQIGGSALDVFEVEKPFAPDHPLLSAPNIVLTPHLGASTREAQVNVSVDVAHQIRDTLNGRVPHSAVNLAGLRPRELTGIDSPLHCCTITMPMNKVLMQ